MTNTGVTPKVPGRVANAPPESEGAMESAEHTRLGEDASRERNWKRWGPYLSERQWGTVREDYSDSGDTSKLSARQP